MTDRYENEELEEQPSEASDTETVETEPFAVVSDDDFTEQPSTRYRPNRYRLTQDSN